MRGILLTVLLTCTSPLFAEHHSVTAGYGVVWVQSDENSNHKFDGAFSVYYRRDYLMVGYSYGKTYDQAKSTSFSNNIQLIDFTNTAHGLTVWLAPRLYFGRMTFSAGAGLGVVYDKTSVFSGEHRHTTTRSGFEKNLSMCASLSYAATANLAIGVMVVQDYWEIDTNREYSTYEVNQDRIAYQVTLSWKF